MLSSTQKGLRKQAKTTDQLQMLIMALEDARLTGQNTYSMLVDFTSAFNMLDHDLLLQIMYDMGFPTDAIDVVKDLYTGATTQVKWGTGLTSPIPVDRGSIQGNSLSPFLFLLYIEPLLRWLQVGGRGYMFGCLTENPEARIRNSLSSAAFADDLAILTSKVSDLRIQADKLSQYSDWAHMHVNNGKTMVSGVLYQNTRATKGGNIDAISEVRAQLENQIKVQGQGVTYLDPRKEFRYLGAWLTMTLDWKYQHQALVKKARKKTEQLLASYATPRQVRKTIENTIKPGITNTLGITPCTGTDLGILDSIITSAMKRSYGLPKGASSALVHEDVESFGLGSESLSVAYAKLHASHLVEDLRDNGRMGIITRAMLNMQLKLVGSCDKGTDALRSNAKYCLRVRQLSQMHENDIILMKDEEPQFTRSAHIVEALQTLNPNGPTHQWQVPCAFLQPLLGLDLNRLEDLTEPGGTHVIDGRHLKRIKGRRVKPKHIAALNRLATLLNEAPGHDNDTNTILRQCNTSPTLTRSARAIHPQNMHITALARNPLPTDIPFPAPHPDQRLITEYLERMRPIAVRQPRPDAAPAAPHQPPPQTSDNPNDRQQGKRTRHAHKEPTHHKDKARKKQSLHREAVKANDVGVRQPTVDCCPCQNHSYKEAQAKKLMHDNKNTTRGQKAAIVIEKLYGHTNQIAAIRGWRMAMENTVTGKRPRTNKPSQRERIQQIQFEVEWAPTYVEEWALHYYELAGYKPRSTTACHRMDFAGRDLNPLEWACTAACEVCWSPDSREYDAEADCHDDLFACNSCEKHYHAECIGQRGWRPQTAQWQCPACINGRFSRAPHPVGKLVRVEWEPSWEPEETLVSTPGGKALLERWIKENHHQPPARMTEKPLDAHLSNLERQGFKTVGEDRWKTTMGDPIRELIHFEMEAINPQLDVHPSTTGECKIEIRTIEMWDKGNPDQPKMRRMACIHKPNGKCVGTVSPYRLLTLRKLFDAALSSGQHSKMTPKPASFEKEMVDMILRHKLKKITKQKQPSPWGIPPTIRQAIADHFNTNKERFSSPLAVPNAETMYWSTHERDQAFGAQTDVYSHKWTGYSQVLPDRDDPSLDKAARWALWSARHGEETNKPVATILYFLKGLRSPGQQAYKKWMTAYPDYFTHIGSTKKAASPLHREEQWTQGADTDVTQPKCQMEIVVVWNSPARRELSDKINLGGLEQELQSAFNNALSGSTPPPELATPNLRGEWWSAERHAYIPGTGKDDALRADSRRSPRAFRTSDPDADMGTWPTSTMREDDITLQYACEGNLRHAWREMAYTDGSRIEIQMPGGQKIARTGAGVYIPDTGEPSEAPRLGKAFTVDPSGISATDTINRAELAGIWAALSVGKRIVASDSATSLSQIRRALLSPMDLRYHKHRDLLELIVASMRDLTSLGQPIYLYKVRAHNGDIGNELVDAVAKRAAICSEGRDLRVPAKSMPSYCTDTWPHFHTTTTGEDTRPRGLENLTSDLHKHMHKKLRLGKSNTSSVYYQSWQHTKPMADGPMSNSYLTHAALTHVERKTTLNWRFGTLWSNKMAYRYKFSNTSQCPLCGEPDGGEHISGGCKHASMERMYTARHHHTGRILLKAISKGSMGAGLVMADLGSAENCEKDGAPVLLYRQVPGELLPTPRDVDETQDTAAAMGPKRKKKLQPDALIVQYPETGTGEQHPHIYIVEFKYCRDTMPENQLRACHTQHEDLIALLTAKGTPRSNIKLVPILLGHSGTIYTEHTLQGLETLGISRMCAKKCAQKMHIDAIKQLHSIVKTRRYLEHHGSPKAVQLPRNQQNDQRGIKRQKQNLRPP
jgi:ribonuclease HI